MKGDPVPDTDHIARFVKPSQAPDGKIEATAFMLRSDEENLSVNWVEFLDIKTEAEKYSEIRKIYCSKFNRIGARAKIAILNVGQTRLKVINESEDERKLWVLHDPMEGDPPDPSHSEIYNLRHDDELIAELILETILEDFSARPCA